MENIHQNRNYIKKTFYKIFSPKAFNLKPMESINLDLQFNLKSAEGMIPTHFQLFPTLTQFGLSLEESNWKTATQSESITVNILNKNYSNTFNIKKRQFTALFAATIHKQKNHNRI